MLQAIWLVHPGEAMCAAFRKRFAGRLGIRIIRGRFEDREPPHGLDWDFVVERHKAVCCDGDRQVPR